MSISPVASLLIVANLYLNSDAYNPYIATGLLAINMSPYVQAFFNKRFWAPNLTLFVYWVVVINLFSKYGLIGTPAFWLFPLAPIAIFPSGIPAGVLSRLIYLLTLFSVYVLKSNGILFLDNSFRMPVNTITEIGSGLIFAGDGA